MKTCVYAPDEPRIQQVATAVAHAMKAEGHDVYMDCYPQPNHDPVDLGVEIGGRTSGCNLGMPILHYIVDALDVVPADWLAAATRGHLYMFADYSTHVRAHKQGLRVAEHVPLGWDMHPPFPDVEQKYDVGFFGDPNPQAIDMLVAVLAEKKYKVGIWGNVAKWKKTGLAPHVVDEEAMRSPELNEQIAQCRFVLDDPANAFPGLPFLHACAAPKTMGLAQYSVDRAQLTINGYGQVWTEHLGPDVNPCGLLAHFTDTNLPFEHGKRTQRAAMGMTDSPFQRYAAIMEVAGYGFNRMQDRWHYIAWLFDNKQLYENAQESCVKREHADIQMDEPYASIIIKYFAPPEQPSDIWYRKFDLDWSKKIESSQLPTMLRVAARRIEQSLEAGSPITPNAVLNAKLEGIA